MFKMTQYSYSFTFLFIIFFGTSFCCNSQQLISESSAEHISNLPYGTGKPYTRWWWNARILNIEDIKSQLDWIKEQGFGGVEVAFIYPVNRDPNAERTPWLSDDMKHILEQTKEYTESIGIGIDFTFGTIWPFGATDIPLEFRTKKFGDSSFSQTEYRGWSLPDSIYVIDHLAKEAFDFYKQPLNRMFKNTTRGKIPTGIFVDSWEVETHQIWAKDLETIFFNRYGYSLEDYMPTIYNKGFEDTLYDYMKLVSELVKDGFYLPFHENARAIGGFSRAQVAGAPVDLISTYALIDVPETEALLYEPNFSKIVASAAALGQKRFVSSESFTCIYGWPSNHMFEEKILDLKLVADALFANGTNQIIWHGVNFNPIGVDSIAFYATVHVGKTGSLSKDIKSFNDYLTKVSGIMNQGETYSNMAVYLPLEDSWMAGYYPEELQMPWSWGEYEQRYIYFPDEIKGYHPLWINGGFLSSLNMRDGVLTNGVLEFTSLYFDASHIDIEVLKRITELAEKNFPVIVKKLPQQAGRNKSNEFDLLLNRLVKSKGYFQSLDDISSITPLIEGEFIPDYWSRVVNGEQFIFFSNPQSMGLQYPMPFGMSDSGISEKHDIVINTHNKKLEFTLNFEPNQSILLHIGLNGELKEININYIP
jgi:hypothetical protein